MHPIVEFATIGILVCFTMAVTIMAMINHGAFIYYYEPNWMVFAFEVVSGLTASALGIVMMFERLEEYFEEQR